MKSKPSDKDKFGLGEFSNDAANSLQTYIAFTLDNLALVSKSGSPPAAEKRALHGERGPEAKLTPKKGKPKKYSARKAQSKDTPISVIAKHKLEGSKPKNK